MEKISHTVKKFTLSTLGEMISLTVNITIYFNSQIYKADKNHL